MGWFSDNPGSFYNLAKSFFAEHFNFQHLCTFIEENFNYDDPLYFAICIHNDYRHYNYQTPYEVSVEANITTSPHGWILNLRENEYGQIFTRYEFEQLIQYALESQTPLRGGNMRKITHPVDVHYMTYDETYELVPPGELDLYIDDDRRIVLDGVFQTARDAVQERNYPWIGE